MPSLIDPNDLPYDVDDIAAVLRENPKLNNWMELLTEDPFFFTFVRENPKLNNWMEQLDVCTRSSTVSGNPSSDS